MQPSVTPAVSHGESSPPAAAPSKKKMREMKLREDKLADVQSPTLVHCLNCGSTIKLSHKSEYDASHWLRHRTRCVKKTQARELERRMQPASSPASSTTRSSPASSVRALTPPDDEDATQIVDPFAQTDLPAAHGNWQDWNWSQLKSRFIAPL
ncbi:hypothetical protein B0H19DRAFT_1251817 [Mycena capillaripes]|nr:hypothetical protein B0H19DRAFT_1251817 [Mycena capillaripes]